jgi:vitamin B12 transporter
MNFLPYQRRLPGITGALCIAAFSTVWSAEQPLEEVVVVATRLPVPAAKVGNTVSVLNRADIEASQAVAVSDLLARLPGVGVTRSGGPGGLTGLRIRGAESDHTLVLIDGVQINDPAAPGGGFDFGNLLTGGLSRIEVLRGPQSTLYGSQAIGGVVNIVTAEAGGAAGGSLQAEYGSMDSTRFRADVGGRSHRASARVAGEYYRTDGISAFGTGDEPDAFRSTSLAGRLGYEIAGNLNLDLRGHYARGRVQTDGYPPPDFVFADAGDYADKRQRVAYAGLNIGEKTAALQHRLAYQVTHVERDEFSGAIGAVAAFGEYRGVNERAEYQGSWRIAQGYTAVFGLQHETTRMRNDIDPLAADARTDSAFVQLQGEPVRGLTLTGGYRHDDHRSFGAHGSLQFAAAWQTSIGTIVRASWGQGFKAPTLYQLFSGYGNPGLKPETSRGWDMGVEQHWQEGRIRATATWFERDTRQLITFLNCPDPGNLICSAPGHLPFGYYQNAALARASGVELQASLVISPLADLKVNFTHANSRDRSPGSPDYGLQLLRRPKQVLNAALNLHFGTQVTATTALRHVSASPEMNFDVFPAQRIALDAYTLVDLRVAVQAGQDWQIAGRIENLFDRRYETVYQYGTLRRTAYLSVNRRF